MIYPVIYKPPICDCYSVIYTPWIHYNYPFFEFYITDKIITLSLENLANTKFTQNRKFKLLATTIISDILEFRFNQLK